MPDRVRADRTGAEAEVAVHTVEDRLLGFGHISILLLIPSAAVIAECPRPRVTTEDFRGNRIRSSSLRACWPLKTLAADPSKPAMICSGVRITSGSLMSFDPMKNSERARRLDQDYVPRLP